MDKLKDSLSIIAQALSTFRASEVFISFNGGKDCTVLLDLIHSSNIKDAKQIKCIYVRPPKPFSEIEEFVEQCRQHYGITISTVDGGIKAALELICQDDPQLKACIMGSRRSDPYCERLASFQVGFRVCWDSYLTGGDCVIWAMYNSLQETDAGWPPLMRINPLLEWTCEDIWSYIREHNVPYCALYDRGYTSIGDRTNTIPNPHLKVETDSGEVTYLPAYTLQDADKYERAGRL